MVIINPAHSGETFILMLLIYKYFVSLFRKEIMSLLCDHQYFVVKLMEDFSWEFCFFKVLGNLSVPFFYYFHLSMKKY